MDEQLGLLNIEWTRLPALDGSALPAGLFDSEKRRCTRRTLTRGEVATLHSHVNAWHFVRDWQTPCVILEDDAILAFSVMRWLETDAWIPDNADIIRFETFSMKVVLCSDHRSYNGRNLQRLRSLHYGSAAYCLTPKGAAALLARYRRGSDTADDLMFLNARSLCTYQVTPALAIQKDIHDPRGRDASTSSLEEERMAAVARDRFVPDKFLRRQAQRLVDLCHRTSDRLHGCKIKRVSCDLS